MAKKTKNKTRRQSWISKGINIGLIALGFSRIITTFLSRMSLADKIARIQRDATFGLSEGKFNLKAGLKMYAPAGAAIGLGKLKSYLMRKFPIRR